MSTSIIGNSTKRDGSCVIRSSGGMAILDETYEFIVQATAKDEPYVSVLATTGLPLVNVTVSPSGYGVCKSKTANRRVQNPFIWDVVCEFSSEVDERQSGQDPASDANSWIPVYETKFERLQETVTKDFSGVSIANSAGQPFEVGLTVGRFIPVWEFFQFESTSVTDETIIARNETVNSGTFKGRAAKTLLLTVMSSVVGFYYGSKRRLTQYSLKYNVNKWTHKRLDVGTVYLDGTDRKAYLSDDVDEPTVILGPLNGSGSKVTGGNPPALLEFDMYPTSSFSFLRL